MKHLKHALEAALGVVVAAVPAIVADPSVAHYIAQHPTTAAYFPIVSGIIVALYKAAKSTPPSK